MMCVSNPLWKEGSALYVPCIYDVVFAQTKDIQFSEVASEDIWFYFADKAYQYDLINRIGTKSLLKEITRFAMKYCKWNYQSLNTK